MRRTYSKPLWRIARYRTGGTEALKIPLATGGEALPVFSFEDEARMFLKLAWGGEPSWSSLAREGMPRR